MRGFKKKIKPNRKIISHKSNHITRPGHKVFKK